MQSRNIEKIDRFFDDEFYDLILENVEPCYSTGARRFIEYLRLEHLQLSLEGVRQYLKAIQHLRANTFNHYRSAVIHTVKAILKKQEAVLTVAESHAIKAALKNLPGCKQIKPRAPEILTKEEVRNFIERCPDRSIALIVEFLYNTALRISEALGIRNRDLVDMGSYYKIPILGKGNKERWVVASIDLIERIRRRFQSSTYLFESHYKDGRYDRAYVSMRIKKLAKEILGKNISAHTMRHSRATHLLKTDGRLTAVAGLLGHADPATTARIYIRDEYSDQELLTRQLGIINGKQDV